MYDFSKTIHDDKEFIEAMRQTEMFKTEEEIMREYNKCPDKVGTKWVQIMLAGILGNTESAKDKYPELFI
jgi:hypothetical protein